MCNNENQTFYISINNYNRIIVFEEIIAYDLLYNMKKLRRYKTYNSIIERNINDISDNVNLT